MIEVVLVEFDFVVEDLLLKRFVVIEVFLVELDFVDEVVLADLVVISTAVVGFLAVIETLLEELLLMVEVVLVELVFVNEAVVLELILMLFSVVIGDEAVVIELVSELIVVVVVVVLPIVSVVVAVLLIVLIVNDIPVVLVEDGILDIGLVTKFGENVVVLILEEVKDDNSLNGIVVFSLLIVVYVLSLGIFSTELFKLCSNSEALSKRNTLEKLGSTIFAVGSPVTLTVFLALLDVVLIFAVDSVVLVTNFEVCMEGVIFFLGFGVSLSKSEDMLDLPFVKNLCSLVSEVVFSLNVLELSLVKVIVVVSFGG